MPEQSSGSVFIINVVDNTVFIQIDANALIDAHLLNHQAPGMYLRSDFEPIIYAPTSCRAHTQCATIRMNTLMPPQVILLF